MVMSSQLERLCNCVFVYIYNINIYIYIYIYVCVSVDVCVYVCVCVCVYVYIDHIYVVHLRRVARQVYTDEKGIPSPVASRHRTRDRRRQIARSIACVYIHIHIMFESESLFHLLVYFPLLFLQFYKTVFRFNTHRYKLCSGKSTLLSVADSGLAALPFNSLLTSTPWFL